MALSIEFRPTPRVARWNVSTRDDPAALDFYQSGIRDWYRVSEIDDGGTFFTDNVIYQFGPYVLGRGKSVGQVLVRGPGEIKRSGLDSVAIMLDLAGIKGDANGIDVNMPAGSFHLRDLARPSALKVEAVDAVTLAMPRDVAPRWLVERNIHGLSIDGTPQISRLLTGHLMALLEAAPSLTVDQGVAGIEAALVMAEKAFTHAGNFTPTQTEAIYRGLRASAVTLIDRGIHDPALKIEQLTRSLGVSRATLFRAFAMSGGIKLYIKRRRLELARQALQARVDRRPTVGEIAHAYGFVSESHFSRSFRIEYGYAPGRVEPVQHLTWAGGQQGGVRYDLLLDWMNGNAGTLRLTCSSRTAPNPLVLATADANAVTASARK